MQLFAFNAQPADPAAGRVLSPTNDIDPRTLDLTGVTRVDLNFPAFTDGRAFSQAFLLRRRLGFSGDIRATGDVLVDQLQQMQRSGFTQAVLAEGQDLDHGRKLLALFSAFYQGDAVVSHPLFARSPEKEAA
jgi:uncharacterized protein (DUF934 family)